MKQLIDLPNIGKTFAEKLKQIGSKNAIIKIPTIENSGACIAVKV